MYFSANGSLHERRWTAEEYIFFVGNKGGQKEWYRYLAVINGTIISHNKQSVYK